jgi:hypothetical protein
MTLINKSLAGLLVVQVALVGLLWRPVAEPAYTSTPVLAFAADAITGLEIIGRTADGETPEPVKLVKEGTDWQIASEQGYPADSAKVATVLSSLADMKIRAPIATQAANHAKLEVAEAKNTRRVKITAGAETIDLLLGAGSGSAVNVRKGDANEVFSVRGFTAWSIGDQASRYFDTEYVKADVDTLDSLTVINTNGDFTLEKDGTGWHIAGAEAGTLLNETKVQELLAAVTRVRMTEPAGKTDRPAWGLTRDRRVEWTSTESSETNGSGYTIGAEVDGKIYVRADRNPFVVLVTSSTVSKALDINVDELLLNPDVDNP